jgi:hypothetical protein
LVTARTSSIVIPASTQQITGRSHPFGQGTIAASNPWRLFAWDQHRCAMPRYYFDVDIQDVSSVSDTEGMELQSLVEAKAEALSAISGVAQRFMPSLPEMSIHVRDETGQDVLRVRLSLVVEEIPE